MRGSLRAVLGGVALAAGLTGLALAPIGPASVLHAETAALPAPAPLEAPQGQVILRVTGPLAVQNAPGAALFDAAMLAALPRKGFATSTIWTEGVSRFEGVELATLLDRLGVHSGQLTLRAINDYAVQMPVADLRPGGALLADRRDGKPMSIRDKGPLWIVFPYDLSDEFRNEVVYSRSVWQLDRIEVTP